MALSTPSSRTERRRVGVRGAAEAVGIGALVGILTLIGLHKFGLGGIAVPIVAVALVALMCRPFAMLCVTVGLAVLCEGSTFQIPLMHQLYRNLYGGIEPIDLLVTITFFSVLGGLLRQGRRPRLPPIPAIVVTLMVFACVDGVLVGHDAQVSLKSALLSLNPIVELVVMTFAVYNLGLSNERIVTLLRWCLAMAALKAVLGLVVMSLGLSADVESGTTITYYEPTANWFGLVAILGLLAAGLGDGGTVRAALNRPLSGARERWSQRAARRRQPAPLIQVHASRRERRRWEPMGSASGVRGPGRRPSSSVRALGRGLRARWGPLVFTLAFVCLLLSYRRSFWLGGALALVILIPLAATPRKRRMIVPVVVLVAGAIWMLQAVDHQAVSPIFARASSLQPGELAANAQDRYRLDERANVIAEIKTEPLTGIGVVVPWVATVRQMGLEHTEGRYYVDFGLLYWWLKMGVLGAAAYLGFLVAMATLAFRTWRRHAIRELRAFGLASLCAVFGLAAIETTAAFSGVDPRFSVLIGAQFGLLAVLAERRTSGEPASRPAWLTVSAVVAGRRRGGQR